MLRLAAQHLLDPVDPVVGGEEAADRDLGFSRFVVGRRDIARRRIICCRKFQYVQKSLPAPCIVGRAQDEIGRQRLRADRQHGRHHLADIPPGIGVDHVLRGDGEGREGAPELLEIPRLHHLDHRRDLVAALVTDPA